MQNSEELRLNLQKVASCLAFIGIYFISSILTIGAFLLVGTFIVWIIEVGKIQIEFSILTLGIVWLIRDCYPGCFIVLSFCIVGPFVAIRFYEYWSRDREETRKPKNFPSP